MKRCWDPKIDWVEPTIAWGAPSPTHRDEGFGRDTGGGGLKKLLPTPTATQWVCMNEDPAALVNRRARNLVRAPALKLGFAVRLLSKPAYWMLVPEGSQVPTFSWHS